MAQACCSCFIVLVAFHTKSMKITMPQSIKTFYVSFGMKGQMIYKNSQKHKYLFHQIQFRIAKRFLDVGTMLKANACTCLAYIIRWSFFLMLNIICKQIVQQFTFLLCLSGRCYCGEMYLCTVVQREKLHPIRSDSERKKLHLFEF